MRDGKAFIESLRDGRDVWLNGERVKDVTEHPHLRPSIDSIARLYDMQFQVAHRETLTVHSDETGGMIGRTFQIPRTREDLLARRNATRAWMETSFGFMGRAPDFLNATVMALRTKSSFFAQQSKERQQAVEGYYRHAASQDVFLTHALNDPLPNKTKARHAQEDAGVVLQGVEETSKGLIVSGAKVVATAAAYANEAIVFPMPANLVPGDERHALAMCIPMDSAGLKVLCRGSYAHPGRVRDYPLSSRFDEMDSVLVFDRVLVPWERIFLYGDIRLSNAMFADCRVRDMTAHQTAIRLLVKLEFIYALMVKIARALGIEETAWVAQLLGEATANVEIVRNAIIAGEAEAKVDPENGMIYPDFTALLVPRVMGPRIYGDFVQKLRRISGSMLMQAPASMEDFSSAAGPFMQRYLAGTGVSAEGKIELARLAWDICGTEFGSRHVLYELFYAGDPDAILAGMHRGYAHKTAHLKMFDRFMGK